MTRHNELATQSVGSLPLSIPTSKLNDPILPLVQHNAETCELIYPLT